MTDNQTPSEKDTSAANWSVYIILCTGKSLYTGISTAPYRRFIQHKSGRGARYFRTCLPLEIVYLECGHTRSSATRRELQIKRMTKAEKNALLISDTSRTTPS